VTQQPRGLVAVRHAELAAGPVAVGVDGRLRHAQLAGDFLRAQVLIDQPQAFALARREQLDRIFADDRAVRHGFAE
jgi:hypothetical protein